MEIRNSGAGSTFELVACRACLLLGVLLGGGCATEPGETTALATASGGVIGAALGAVVGNQTGDAGAGLAVGGIAGASAGALIGNQIEAQDRRLAAQEERAARLQEEGRARRREIDRLRGAGGDWDENGEAADIRDGVEGSEARRGGDPRLTNKGGWSNRLPVERRSVASSLVDEERGDYSRGQNFASNRWRDTSRNTTIEERDVPVANGAARFGGSVLSEDTQPLRRGGEVAEGGPAANPSLARASNRRESTREVAVEREAVADDEAETAAPDEAPASGGDQPSGRSDSHSASMARSQAGDTAGDLCAQAAGEVRSGDAAAEMPDKLFHYRRALRLCPSKPDYHVRLGKLYLSLKRTADAVYEFEEAVKLDPEHREAKSLLQEAKQR